jgi:hypothetical protein
MIDLNQRSGGTKIPSVRALNQESRENSQLPLLGHNPEFITLMKGREMGAAKARDRPTRWHIFLQDTCTIDMQLFP